MGHMVTYCALAAMLLGLLASAVYSRRKSIALSEEGWQDLLARVQQVDLQGVTIVALDYLHPQYDQTSIQPAALWKLVGDHQGLRRMSANADLMLALAAHAQHWNFDEAVIVSERMRRDALRLRRAVSKIEFGFLPFSFLRGFYVRTPFHIQEAAAAYYLMRQRLMALYASSHSGRLPALSAVL